MNWMFLDAPPDGSVMLVWQPSNQLGQRFASDGYVWADAENTFTQEIKGNVRELESLSLAFTKTRRTRSSTYTFTKVAIILLMRLCRPTQDFAIA